MSDDTRAWYRRASRELAGTSARQSQWCRGVADDERMLQLLGAVQHSARQPSLLVAVAAWLGAPDADYPVWSEWVLAHRDEVCAELPRRRVQTNEPQRCVPLLVGLGRIRGPIALIELGASAGLCLLPDHYGYLLHGAQGPRRLGQGELLLEAQLDETPDAPLAPAALPEIVWRRGIDLAPLDVRRDDDRRWLQASLPPDRPERHARLRAALEVAAREVPDVVAGDALAALPEVAAQAPAGATLVVATLGTAVYLPGADRGRLLASVAELGAHLVSYEPRPAVHAIADRWDALVADGRADPDARYLLAVDGEPVASGTAHGDQLTAVRLARHF